MNNKIFYLFIIFFLYSSSGYGQDLKKKTNKITNMPAQEIYYVLKDNKVIKHGDYKIKDNKGLFRVIGQYDKGTKIGKWEYYDEIFSGTAIQKVIYDYDNQKILYHGVGGNLQKTTDVKAIEYQEIYDYTPAFYSDGILHFASQLYSIFDKMKSEKINLDFFIGSTAYIQFEINTDGKISLKNILKSYPNLSKDKLQYFVELVLPQMSGIWIPKTFKDGTKENSSVTLPLKVD